MYANQRDAFCCCIKVDNRSVKYKKNLSTHVLN